MSWSVCAVIAESDGEGRKVWIGMMVVLVGVLAWLTILIIAIAMIAKLANHRLDERERRRIVLRSTVTMAAAGAAWALSVALSLWWNVLRSFPWRGLGIP